MPTKSSHYKKAMNIDKNFKKEIDELIKEINIRDLKEVDELSSEDIDTLLNSITINNESTMTLMDKLEKKILENDITNPKDIYELKILLLLDYLGKNMFMKSIDTDHDHVSTNKKIVISRKNNLQNSEFHFQYDTIPNLKNKKISKKILRRYQPDNNM